MTAPPEAYRARLNIDYPEKLDRLSTFFRLIWAIPILVIVGLLTATGNETLVTETGERIQTTCGGILGGLVVATMLMIVFRLRYPRWWFDFARELTRFSARIGTYVFLLTDRYPSTVDEQSVHLDIDYPDVERGLNRWLPLVSGCWPSRTTSCLPYSWLARSSCRSLLGLPSCSPGATHEHCSTTSWASGDGRFE